MQVWWLFVVFLALASALAAPQTKSAGQLNNRPIIGLLTQAVSSDPSFPNSLGKYYLPASYVKWIESAGARVVPIFFDASDANLTSVFNSVNGILLPGGDYYLPHSQYERTSTFLYNLTIEANDRGDYMPFWGTCQGFEQLALITSRNCSILSEFSGENISLALDFTAAAPSSRLFGSLPKDAYSTFATLPVTENLHQLGLSPASYNENLFLREFYDILSTNKDKQGRVFVSAMESRKYPIYGTQFHPERDQFEWDPTEPIAHTAQAVRATKSLANFLVSEARKNMHHFPSVEAESAALIYGTSATLTESINISYEQTYFW